ncbi:putative zinc finger protein, partial [Ixodes scapularis]
MLGGPALGHLRCSCGHGSTGFCFSSRSGLLQFDGGWVCLCGDGLLTVHIERDARETEVSPRENGDAGKENVPGDGNAAGTSRDTDVKVPIQNIRVVKELVRAAAAEQRQQKRKRKAAVPVAAAAGASVNKDLECPVCGKQFTKKYYLQRHLQMTSCSGGPPPAHPCEVCGKIYSRK